MNLAVIYGYLLRWTGSNLYVSNLVRTFCRQGHRVLLFSQEASPQDMDYVSRSELFLENNYSTTVQSEQPG